MIVCKIFYRSQKRLAYLIVQVLLVVIIVVGDNCRRRRSGSSISTRRGRESKVADISAHRAPLLVHPCRKTRVLTEVVVAYRPPGSHHCRLKVFPENFRYRVHILFFISFVPEIGQLPGPLDVSLDVVTDSELGGSLADLSQVRASESVRGPC